MEFRLERLELRSSTGPRMSGDMQITICQGRETHFDASTSKFDGIRRLSCRMELISLVLTSVVTAPYFPRHCPAPRTAAVLEE